MANQVIDPSTQYTEGDTDATVTGTAILWEDTGDTLRTVSAAKPLPVTATDLATIAGAVKAEDSAHASGNSGIQMLAVRNDSGATLSDTNLDYTPISVDSTGRLYLSGNDVGGLVVQEDSQHTSTDGGIMPMAVINANATILAGTEGDYVPFAADNRGRIQLSGVANGGLVVGEDSPHVSTEGGILAMAVRNEGAAVTTSTDGDNSYISVDSRGRPLAVIHAVNAGGGAGAEQQGFFREDTAHTTGDAGVQMLAVRNDDFATTLSDTNGDYTPIAVSASGKVHISSNYLEDSGHSSSHVGTFILGVQNTNGATLSGSDLDYTGLATNHKGSVYTEINSTNASSNLATNILKLEDSAHASGDAGVMSLAVLKATPADTAGTDGDYQPLQMSAGRLWTSATVTNTVTTTGTATITKTALTPSSPTAASVGVASASALAANASRKGLVLTNTSSATISLGLGAAAVLNSGITLTPYGVWVMDEYTFCTSQVFAIASAAASNLAIQEFA